jgi:hypothetical protein
VVLFYQNKCDLPLLTNKLDTSLIYRLYSISTDAVLKGLGKVLFRVGRIAKGWLKITLLVYTLRSW